MIVADPRRPLHARHVGEAVDGTRRDRRSVGHAAEQGWIALFSLMAMISLNLGLLNLMPIPVLDGGHIAILALEGVSRRDFSMKVKEKMLLAGFVLLLMLMVTVIYNDLMRIQWIRKTGALALNTGSTRFAVLRPGSTRFRVPQGSARSRVPGSIGF